ncbi:hypothetical protein P2W49_20525 [Yersinia intermedia]|nr:hypothetical protein P2W49_20525 [Yersinia intermedia]
MSKKFSDEDIRFILDKINSWEGKDIKWDLVCDSLCEYFCKRPTRQALSRHPAILYAYKNIKHREHAVVVPVKKPQTIAYAANRIAKLESDNTRLADENSRLLVMVRDLQMIAYSKCNREEQIR